MGMSDLPSIKSRLDRVSKESSKIKFSQSHNVADAVDKKDSDCETHIILLINI